MIVNQKKNASFRSTLEYVLGKEEATLIDTNMGGETPRQLAAEFAAARRHRPNLKRACGHIIISIPHMCADHLKGEYHEHLDDEEYVAIARRWLIGMEFLGEGLSCSQYLIARHHDTLHEHIHIIASRIRMDGSVVSDSWDYRRSEVIVRQLEKEFGLEATPCSNSRVAETVEASGIETTVSDRSAPTRKQKHHSDKPTVKQRLADLIDEACSDSPTVTQLIGRLQHQGVIVHPQFSTKGLFKKAIAFELDGVQVAGNKLGSAYSFPGLLRKRGVQYDPERDNPALEAALSCEVVALKEPSPLASTFEPPIQHQEKEPPPIEAFTQPDVVFQPTRVEQAENLPTKLDILKVEWDSQQRRWVSIASDDPNYPINQAAFKEQPEIKPEPLVEKEQSLEKKPTPTRRDSRPTEEQLQQAEYIYHIAWLIFQQASRERKVKPLGSGGGSYFEDKDYFFALNERDNRFAVVHCQRGLLYPGTIEQVDIEAFGSYSRPLPSSQKPPQSQPPPQLELD
ncbi:MAG TPA: relaxase/mobilization nuclease domain-containing protein [Allocoleopsis sp.]